MFKFGLKTLPFVIAISASGLLWASGNKNMSKEKSKSTLGALVSGQYMPTKEKVLGEILRGALENMHYTKKKMNDCLLYTSPSPRDKRQSRMPSSA